MLAETGYYRNLVEKQEGKGDKGSFASSRNSSNASLASLDVDEVEQNAPAINTGVAQIEFKDVHFAYPTRPKKKIFSGFNLSIRRGETVALVGPRYAGGVLVRRFSLERSMTDFVFSFV